MPTIQDTICIQVFRKIDVDHLVRSTTRVNWDLGSNFRDPLPHTFRLQAGRTGLTTADDWTDVGAAADDVFFLDDSDQRLYGKTFWTNYRVQLTTPVATYYSQPAAVFGRLTCRDWRIYNEVVRKECLTDRFVSADGYILKRRLYGTPCDCLDALTNEVRDNDCAQCYGSGIVGGFFAALPDQPAQLDLGSRHEQLDVAVRGTVNPMAVSARFIGWPQLNENDVWVHRSSDRRYYVHSVKNLAELKGVPLIVQWELRLAPTTDPIYDFPLV